MSSLNCQNYEAKKRLAFETSQTIMKKIYKVGWLKYAAGLDDLFKAFDLKKHGFDEQDLCPVCCIDEGTPWGHHSPGSCILLEEKDFERFLRVGGVDSLTSHDGCGAAKLYCQIHGLPVEKSDQIAAELIQKRAEKYNLHYHHLTAEEMKRPPEFHDARVCYVDGTDKFNYLGVQGLPKGIVVDYQHLEPAIGLADVRLTLDIIFGNHGWGEFLDEKNPFIITAIAKNEIDLASIKAELNQIEHPYGNRVIIDGFIAPLEI